MQEEHIRRGKHCIKMMPKAKMPKPKLPCKILNMLRNLLQACCALHQLRKNFRIINSRHALFET